jgi:uncharacterized protein (TIGR00106 family)
LVIAEISVIPLGSGASVSKFVKAALKEIKSSKVKFTVGPMSTTIETDSIDELFEVLKKAHESVFEMGSKRVVTLIKIDDRRDRKSSIQRKLNSIKDY